MDVPTVGPSDDGIYSVARERDARIKVGNGADETPNLIGPCDDPRAHGNDHRAHTMTT